MHNHDEELLNVEGEEESSEHRIRVEKVEALRARGIEPCA